MLSGLQAVTAPVEPGQKSLSARARPGEPGRVRVIRPVVGQTRPAVRLAGETERVRRQRYQIARRGNLAPPQTVPHPPGLRRVGPLLNDSTGPRRRLGLPQRRRCAREPFLGQN